MKTALRTACALLISASVLSGVTHAGVQSNQPDNAVKQTVEYREYLQVIGQEMGRIRRRTQSETAVEAYLAAQGYEVVARPEISGPSLKTTQPSDIYLPGPIVAYNRTRRQYVIHFGWRWRNRNWQNDSSCQWPFNCNVGGPDLWAIHLDKNNVLRLDYQLTNIWDSDGDATVSYDYPVFNSGNNGAAFEYQDIFHTRFPNPWYTTNSGEVILFMSQIGSGTVAFRSQMAHTWNDSTITGGQFSNSGLSLSFSSEARKWNIQGSGITYYSF